MKLAALTVIALLTCGVAAAGNEEMRLQTYTLLTSRISADNWKLILDQINDDGSKGEIQSISKTRKPEILEKGVYRVWVRSDFSPSRFFGEAAFEYDLTQGDFDCGQYRRRSVSWALYSLQGNEPDKVVATETVSDLKWHSVAPGSVGEALLKAVCKEVGFGVPVGAEQNHDERRSQMLALLTSRIPTDDWKVIFTRINDEGTEGEVNSLSKTRKRERLAKGVYRVWLRSDYSPARHHDNGRDSDYELEQTDWDCSQYRFRTVVMVFYSLKAKDAVSTDTDSDPKWLSAVPGSLGDAELQGVCKEAGFKKNKD